MKSRAMPGTLFGHIWQVSARYQVGLCLLYVTVFALSVVPLELQRRIVNDAIGKGALDTIVWLALAYAAAALAFVSGLAKVNDPWGDVVNWYREFTAVDMRYQLVAEAMREMAKEEVPG